MFGLNINRLKDAEDSLYKIKEGGVSTSPLAIQAYNEVYEESSSICKQIISYVESKGWIYSITEFDQLIIAIDE